MKKILTSSIVFILIGIVAYNNSNMHVSKYIWKYNDYIEGYDDVLVFSIGGKESKVYRYEWPYIYKYDKEIGHVIFCIADRMWVKYNFEGAKVVEYVGK